MKKNLIEKTIEGIRRKMQNRVVHYNFDDAIDWEENDHPRSKDGKFKKKGAGETGGAKVSSPKSSYGVSSTPSPKTTGANASLGEVKSGRNGDFRPKSERSKRIDTADAVSEFKNGKHNSLESYVDDNGVLSEERQKVHDEIVYNFFKDKIPAKGTPTMIMSGGGPASGKSKVTKDAESNFGVETMVKIDPDEIKTMFPGYQEMAVEYYESGEKTQNAAAFYHEESSALAKRIYQYGLDNGVNVVYDGTGDGNIGSVKKKIEQAREAGYRVEGKYVTVDTEEALSRNQQRYEHGVKKYEEAKAKGEKTEPPRVVPDDRVEKIHRAVSDIVPEVAGMFDSYELTDNNGDFGAEKPVIATCENGGELKVVKGQEDKLQRFLDKGEMGYKVGKDGIVRKKG